MHKPRILQVTVDMSCRSVRTHRADKLSTVLGCCWKNWESCREGQVLYKAPR